MSDLFSKANSIKCHIKHHSDLGLGISVMCLDEKCISNKKAICAICAKESHTNHKVISISKIDQCITEYQERWVNNKLKQKLVEDFGQIVEEIEQCFHKYGNQFQEILDEINQVQNIYTTYIQCENLTEQTLQQLGIELLELTKLDAGTLSLKFSGVKQIHNLKTLVLEMQALNILINKAQKQNDVLQQLIMQSQEKDQLKQFQESLEQIQYNSVIQEVKQEVSEVSFSLCDKNLIKLKLNYFNSVTAIDVTNDGQLFAGGSNWSNKVVIYDLDSMTELKCLLCQADRIQALKFSPNKKWLLIGSGKTGDVWMQDVNNFDQKPIIFKGHREGINRFSFSNDSKYFCSVSGDRTAIVWDTENYRMKYQLTGHIQAVNGCSFGGGQWLQEQDNKCLILGTISDDKNIIIYKNDKILKKWQAHNDEGYCLEFSYDYEWIISSGKDKLIKLWSTRNFNLLSVYEGHQRGIWTCGFSPYSQYIGSASWDDTIRIQNVNNKNDVISITNEFLNLPQITINGFGRCVIASSKTQFNIWRR